MKMINKKRNIVYIYIYIYIYGVWDFKKTTHYSKRFVLSLNSRTTTLPHHSISMISLRALSSGPHVFLQTIQALRPPVDQ